MKPGMRGVRGPGLLWTILLVGCSASDAAVPDSIERSDEALVALPSLATWSRQHVASHGRVRIGGTLQAGARYSASVTDRWGWPSGHARPRVTLDVVVRDGEGHALTDTTHNSSQDGNGTQPDPIAFEAPASGAVVVVAQEIDGFGGDFELRIDRAAGAPPAPTVASVHESGDTGTDVSPATHFAALLAGGGADHDGATSALIDAGGHGDAVILRMDDTGGAYATYFVARGAHAATEIALDPQGGNDDVTGAALATLRARADEPWIAARIDRAEILFFAGGNQTKYVDAWQGTSLAAAVNRLVARGGAVGGTSAGMHALAAVVHTPRGTGDSVTSSVALEDPYIDQGEHAGTRSLDFAASPFTVPLLGGLVVDTHWTQRDRRGRSLVFLARLLTDKVRPLGGISLLACDEGVAVLFDGAGSGRVFGPAGGAAFLFRPDVLPDRCQDDRSLDWQSGVPFVRVEATAAGAKRLELGGAPGPLRARVVDGVVAAP